MLISIWERSRGLQSEIHVKKGSVLESEPEFTIIISVKREKYG